MNTPTTNFEIFKAGKTIKLGKAARPDDLMCTYYKQFENQIYLKN